MIPQIVRIVPEMLWDSYTICPHDDCVHCGDDGEGDGVWICGACSSELDDGDRCEKCGITYVSRADGPHRIWHIDAVFTDPEAAACLTPKTPDTKGNSPVGWCYLPAGHESKHYYLQEDDVRESKKTMTKTEKKTITTIQEGMTVRLGKSKTAVLWEVTEVHEVYGVVSLSKLGGTGYVNKTLTAEQAAQLEIGPRLLPTTLGEVLRLQEEVRELGRSITESARLFTGAGAAKKTASSASDRAAAFVQALADYEAGVRKHYPEIEVG